MQRQTHRIGRPTIPLVSGPGGHRCTNVWGRTKKIGWFLLTVMVATALVGCVPVRARSEVVGVYELNGGKQKITLEVFPSETFTETIIFASGQTERRTGGWHWAPGRIGFDGLWIPKSFAPDYILHADSAAKGTQPKFTDAGYWSLSAENHWGTMTLPIFPDADIGFTMVRHGL
jgi:hypothetical protein